MGTEDEYDDTPKFNKPAVAIGHVAKTALKWAAIGAAIGAAVLAGAGIFMMISNPVGMAFGGGALLAGKLGGILMAALTTGLTWGAVAGAIGGGLFGVTSVNEAIDNESDRVQARQDNFRMRRESNSLLAHQRDLQAVELQRQAQGMGLSSNVGFGKGAEGERALT